MVPILCSGDALDILKMGIKEKYKLSPTLKRLKGGACSVELIITLGKISYLAS